MEKLLWEIAFALAVIGGVAGLWALQRSAAKDALGAAKQTWQQQAASREKAIQAQANKAAEDIEAMRLEAAARAVDWEARTRAADENHVRKSQEWESERTSLERAKATFAQNAEKFRPDHANVENLKQRLTDMRESWLNEAATEWDCQKVLARNLWVLSPDYIVGKFKMYVKSTVPMQSILQGIFPDHQENPNLTGAVGGLTRPDLCGWVEARSLGPSATTSNGRLVPAGQGPTTEAECVFLVIELKNPQISLTWNMLEQAHAYAWYILQNVKELQAHRIECLVVGKDCKDVKDAHIRWGSGPHDAIRIVPMSYKQLYERAEAMAQPYLHKQFGGWVEDLQDVDSIRPVPEVSEGQSLASQIRHIDEGGAGHRLPPEPAHDLEQQEAAPAQ